MVEGEGDKCTKFFHRMANSQRSNNSMETLMVDGVRTSNHPKITSYHILNYYKKLLSEQFS